MSSKSFDTPATERWDLRHLPWIWAPYNMINTIGQNGTMPSSGPGPLETRSTYFLILAMPTLGSQPLCHEGAQAAPKGGPCGEEPTASTNLPAILLVSHLGNWASVSVKTLTPCEAETSCFHQTLPKLQIPEQNTPLYVSSLYILGWFIVQHRTHSPSLFKKTMACCLLSRIPVETACI